MQAVRWQNRFEAKAMDIDLITLRGMQSGHQFQIVVLRRGILRGGFRCRFGPYKYRKMTDAEVARMLK